MTETGGWSSVSGWSSAGEQSSAGEESSTGAGKDRPRTFTEQARREQLLDVTVAQIAARGYGGASLSRIAEAAGITKAAVLYHFRSKDALVTAAYAHVLEALVASVGAAVEQAAVIDRPAAYIHAMVAHLRDHPQHTGVLTEVGMEKGFDHEREERWAPLAGLIDAAASARDSGGPGGAADSRALAVIIGGAIDGIVAERLEDDGFDVAAAADLLIVMLPG